MESQFISKLFEQIMLGNGSVITVDNIGKLNQVAMNIYQTENLSENEIETLKKIIMICNALYNRTDMAVLPIEDGFYDLLLEKYKKYDEHFQVGSAIVDFRNLVENDIENPRKIAVSPIVFLEDIKRDEIHQEVFDQIIRKGKQDINIHNFATSPIKFNDQYISKRTHNTEHNHPSLVGTLDKCKFVFNQDAIDAGAFNDPNVKVLERDFFQDHISRGIISPNQEIEVVVELKYDGLSVEADCGLELESARSRGDTGIGEAIDMTPILKGYIFKQAKCMIGEKPIGVKFEAIMTKDNLARFNNLRGKKYANCRTAIIGLFGASDAYLYRDLITLIPLAIDREQIPSISNRMEEIEFINRVFPSHGEPLRYCYFKGSITEVMYMIKAFWDEAKIARDYLNFMYDGIVVSYVDENIRAKLGRKNFINKYSMAVKFDPEEKQTIFRGYTYEVGQHGQITPMIHYDPVEFIGTIHTKSTGSSLERFRNLGLRYGDVINVTYVNDVMPYVSKCECEHNRNNTAPLIEFPHSCPICASTLVESDSGKTAICPNPECPGRSVQRMTNMLQKLNLKGFAEASIKALGCTHLYELYDLFPEEFVEKLGEADGNSMVDALLNLANGQIYDYIIIGALGFTSIARKKWKSILDKITIKDLYDLYSSSRSDSEFQSKIYQVIPNIGEITCRTIVNEFSFFEKDILFIINNFHYLNSFGSVDENALQIRFTGIRNKQLSELLCNAGYDADDSSSVTKKTDILLVPYNGFNSSKVNKVSENCKIVPIDQFLKSPKDFINDLPDELLNQIVNLS